MSANDDARDLLRRAQDAHSARQIEQALALTRRAIDTNPGLVDAWTYLGTTLVTRRLAYEEGLQALERALELAPEDAGVHYSLGWCYEFVAYRLEKQAARPNRDPLELYRLAERHLQRCLDLDPEPGLKEDAEDLLAAVQRRL